MPVAHRLPDGEELPPTISSSPGGTENLCFTNSLGLRDVEIPRDPAPEAVAVVLGDSMTRSLHGRSGGFRVIHDTIMSVDLANKLAHVPQRILGSDIFDGPYRALLNTSRLVFLISIEIATRIDAPGLVTRYRDAKQTNYQALKYFRDVSASTPSLPFCPMPRSSGTSP